MNSQKNKFQLPENFREKVLDILKNKDFRHSDKQNFAKNIEKKIRSYVDNKNLLENELQAQKDAAAILKKGQKFFRELNSCSLASELAQSSLQGAESSKSDKERLSLNHYFFSHMHELTGHAISSLSKNKPSRNRDISYIVCEEILKMYEFCFEEKPSPTRTESSRTIYHQLCEYICPLFCSDFKQNTPNTVIEHKKGS